MFFFLTPTANGRNNSGEGITMVIFFPQQKVKHSKLSDGVEQALQNKKYVTGVDAKQLDVCYPAIIQSGGKYSLKFSTTRLIVSI